jgi:hypothetical protein
LKWKRVSCAPLPHVKRKRINVRCDKRKKHNAAPRHAKQDENMRKLHDWQTSQQPYGAKAATLRWVCARPHAKQIGDAR